MAAGIRKAGRCFCHVKRQKSVIGWGRATGNAPLFKGLLQSLCRTHCALTTIALVCSLVLGSSFLWLFAVSSCPFHSVSMLHFHAPPVLRSGLRNMIASTLLTSCRVLFNLPPMFFFNPYSYKGKMEKNEKDVSAVCEEYNK